MRATNTNRLRPGQSALAIAAMLLGFQLSALRGAEPGEAELLIKKFQVEPGFKVELFAAEPMLANPVAFTLDGQGRVYVVETHRFNNSVFDITQNTNWLSGDLALRTVADRTAFMSNLFATNLTVLTRNSERLRLLVDTNGDGRADTATTFADGFNQIPSGIAAGVLARGDNVWFSCIPDLWRFRDPKHGGVPESRERLHSGFGVHIGVTGHDLHGLAFGPDGKIYFSSGDRGFHVQAGTNVYSYPDTGGVLRCNPDGSDLEVFATGLRNPQELAFDQHGNLFAGDNDTAGPDDSRLIHVVEGADYGWRCSYQHMKGFGPWVREKVWEGKIDGFPPHSGLPAQGPSGLVFYPGTGLSDEYLNRFFICDFPGGIHSFAVEPKGASFHIKDRRKFLWNLWPTDVDFGPDGRMYVSDWVAGWTITDKGRLYRVTQTGFETNGMVLETRRLLAEGMEGETTDSLVNLLGHKNKRVRQEAQFALAERGAEALEKLVSAALRASEPLARLHAIWGLGQIRAAGRERLPEDKLLKLLGDADPEIRAQSTLLCGQSAPLLPLLEDENARVRFFAAARLGYLGQESAAAPILEMLRRNNDSDPYLVHAGVKGLVDLAAWDVVGKAARDSSFAVRRAALLAYRRGVRPEVAEFLADPDPRLVVEASRAINDVPVTSGLPLLAEHLNRSGMPEAALTRAINANFRLGGAREAGRLATFAATGSAPESARVEALEALGDWESPSAIDRVMGLWRPLPRRDAEQAAKPLMASVAALLESGSEPVAIAALQAVGKLRIAAAAGELAKVFQNGSTAPKVKGAILQTLREIKAPGLGATVAQAINDPDPGFRLAGIQLLDQTPPEEAVRHIANLLRSEKSLPALQATWAALGRQRSPAAEGLVRAGMLDLAAGKVAPELQLDILEAAASSGDPETKARLAGHLAQRPWPGLERNIGPLLRGGDAAVGKAIFEDRQDVACLRCHSLDGRGGKVGPDLKGIGSRQTREYLLESILAPNRQIAKGFANVVLTLKNGTSVAGTLRVESETVLELLSPEDGAVKVAKSDIASRATGLSAMPEGLDKMLTGQDLRNLVEFLASLK